MTNDQMQLPDLPEPDEPIDNSGDTDETAEVGDDIVTAPNPYDAGDVTDQDDGSDPDAYLD